MNEIKLKAYAKINLSIDVTGKRPDGYHDVIMVLQQIDLYDTVTVRSHGDIAGTPVRISSDSAEMPTGQDNIVWKA
ncbi:MAG: 4-(cytidine 5'-diphospho)-2-C-methyl-D-erythritol kinase, partial [Clostridiales bacterium]|nr:4-(cytidine 5'-diphospho)-2-C-methyl-D-erythritol kinase [Clostridiales bacterium]